MKSIITRILRALGLYGSGWERTHPFDKEHGTDTSGWVSQEELPESEPSRVHAVFYAGSQPSVLRAALATLPGPETFTFVDLGCGKGRALMVASEFHFREIVGVELSPKLAAIARRNAALIAGRHPQRPPIRVVNADASTFALPDGDVTIYMYHPFGEEIVAKVAAGVEATLKQGRRIHVVYYNPVVASRFDALPQLQRSFERTLDYAPSERGYGPDQRDTVIIWSSR